MTFLESLHRFLNPNCDHCVHLDELEFERKRESTHCQSCDTLRQMLDTANREKERLLDLIIEKNKPEPRYEGSEVLNPIRTAQLPWRARQAMLEAEDRKKAQVLREHQELLKNSGIDKLESEVLGKEETNAS